MYQFSYVNVFVTDFLRIIWPYLSQKISMTIVLNIVLKLLSRPVVCANFQGLEENIFRPAIAESVKATVHTRTSCGHVADLISELYCTLG